MTIHALVLLAAAALAGCAKADEAPGAGSGAATATATAADAATATATDAGAAPLSAADLDGLLDRAVTMAEAIGLAATTHADDCGALAGALETLVVGNQALFADLERSGRDPEVERRTQAWMAANTPRLDAAMAKARPALERCRDDLRIKAVFDRIARMR